jgi:hypothetical protein
MSQHLCRRGCPFAPKTLAVPLLSSLFFWVVFAHGASPNTAITVSPAEPSYFSTTLGATSALTEATFTLINSGRGAVQWAASVDVAWLELSRTRGSLLPRRQTEVGAHLLDVAQLSVGRYTANVVFTNLSGRMPPLARQVVLTIHLQTSELAVEPAFTRGTSNTVFWTWVPGANEYEVQAAATPDFAGALSSGWFRGTNTTFTGLQDGGTYFFRVHCRSNASVWGQTLAREFAVNENDSVSTATSPGDLVLAGNTNRLWFEDFEEAGSSWTNTLFNDLHMFSYRGVFEKQPLDAATLAPETLPVLPISQAGDQEGRLYAADTSLHSADFTNIVGNALHDVTVDAYIGLTSKQPRYIIEGGVDLRVDTALRPGAWGGDAYRATVGVDRYASSRYFALRVVEGGLSYGLVSGPQIRFAPLSPDDNYHLRFSASGTFLIAQLWEVMVTNGVLREIPVRLGTGTNWVAAYDGSYRQGFVGLSGIAWGDLNLAVNSVFFDDITILAQDGPPHYLSSGSSTAVVTPPNWFERWGELQLTTSVPAPTTQLTVDLLDASGALLAVHLASGTDLGGIPSVARRRSLRLRANLSTSDPTQTPALSEWRIGFHLPQENASQSGWSGLAQSTQDNVPPVLTITSPVESPFFTTNRTVTLTGTAADSGSGISRVTVLNSDAVTTNGFTNWTLNLTLSFQGTNSILVVARDNAVPANFAFSSFRVVYRPPGSLVPTPADSPAEDQPAAGALSGGLETSLPSPPVPVLRIDFAQGVAVISWSPVTAGYSLQAATSLFPSDWQDVPAATASPTAISLTGQSWFFRLVHR